MKTSCYRNINRLNPASEMPVGISIGLPRWIPQSKYRLYQPLAPTRQMLKLSYHEYLPRYRAILDTLDPRKVWHDLHTLSDGLEPVLLCYEQPPIHPDNFCHRRMAADWLEHHLDVTISEWIDNTPNIENVSLFGV